MLQVRRLTRAASSTAGRAKSEFLSVLLSAHRPDAPAYVRCPADYKSAIQQIANLRYECEPTPHWSHEYVSEFAKQTP
jgi:hypothetical protein